MKVSDSKYLRISKPPRAQVARMGRPHAESDSYYAAHYNRCVKEEGEEREDICRWPWNVVKCRRPSLAASPLGGAVKISV